MSTKNQVSTPNPITGEGNWVVKEQRQIRALSEVFLGIKEAQAESCPTGQMTVPGPSTITELAEALRHPLPPPPARPRCYSALEATYKPLTIEMVRDLIAKERAARDVLMQEYAERTGQSVDYCDECDLGVVEEEIEGTWPVVVESVPCVACEGLGVVTI